MLDFGFYFFSGSVTPDPSDFSAVQHTLVAFAGTFVNLLLIVIALAVVFLKKPPLRAPWNELLLQFVFISGINALVFYPPWIWRSTSPATGRRCTAAGFPGSPPSSSSIQVAFIAAGWWGMKNPGMRERIAKLTGLPEGSSMRMAFGSGGEQAVRKVERIDAAKLSGDEKDRRQRDRPGCRGLAAQDRHPYRPRSGERGQLVDLAVRTTPDRTVAVVVRSKR